MSCKIKDNIGLSEYNLKGRYAKSLFKFSLANFAFCRRKIPFTVSKRDKEKEREERLGNHGTSLNGERETSSSLLAQNRACRSPSQNGVLDSLS